MEMPDFETIRSNALFQGGIDPVVLRFRVVEYRKSTGKQIGVPLSDSGFAEAVEYTNGLAQSRADSYFCLEPVGYVQ